MRLSRLFYVTLPSKSICLIKQVQMKKIFVLLMMALATCNLLAKSNFVQVKDGHFVRDGKPYYYVGTNFWYGAILGSEGQGGNRDRLCKELDKRKEMGIDNLRILVGSDGKRGVKTKAEPTLQEAPGVYNDTILAGLDYLLMEMGKRKMVAVETGGDGMNEFPDLYFYSAKTAYYMLVKFNELRDESLSELQSKVQAMYPNNKVIVKSYASELANQYASQLNFRNGILVAGIVTMTLLFGYIACTFDCNSDNDSSLSSLNLTNI